jgi:hypothetical protein
MLGGANWSPWNGGARAQTLGVTTASATTGTTVTAGGSANTKGSWVDIGGTTGFSWKRLLAAMIANSGAVDFVVDIGINVGGNRFVIAEDLRFASSRRIASEGIQYCDLPLFVPAGAQLSARCAGSSASATLQLAITGFSAGLAGMAPFSRCRALYTPSSSRGVAIDPGAAANTKSAWVQLVASSGFHSAAVMAAIGYNGDVARTAASRTALDIGIGASSSEHVLLPDLLLGWGPTLDGPFVANIPLLPLYIPSGTRVVARAQCTDTAAGDRTIDLALWGFEP